MSENPLTGLFSSRTLVRLLSVFLMNPGRSYYQQELVRLLGDSLRPVQLALAKLERAALIVKRREGKQVYYSVETTHPAFADLKSLFAKTFALGDVLRAALEPIADEVQFAFVYGSVAAGEERASSDVDVFLVGSASRGALSEVLGASEATLGREVNLSLYTAERFDAALAANDPFVARLLELPQLWLVGDPREFERLAG
jgi:predicted nucleotidyltransferase